MRIKYGDKSLTEGVGANCSEDRAESFVAGSGNVSEKRKLDCSSELD